jgi:tetraacyldisaccharide 4'-kinase
VLSLARLLAANGIHADVLSRGFGRTSRSVEEVDPSGTADRFGDEPLELAQAGVRVFVSAERFEAGQLAEAAARPARLHLLDDGFQHRQLSRTLDVVLLTLVDVRDALLPAGNLREPLTVLRRAHIFVVREEEDAALAPTLARFPQVPVWLIRRELHLPRETPPNPLAFCALARPDAFFAALRAKLPGVVDGPSFPDHHRYTDRDAQRLLEAAQRRGTSGFVTTAKDAVKLSAGQRRRLSAAGPLLVAGLGVTFLDEASVLTRLQDLLQQP